jgi:virulence-associated protein VagC
MALSHTTIQFEYCSFPFNFLTLRSLAMGIPQVAKLVNLGSQQMIILPTTIQLTGDEVYIQQENHQLILSLAPSSEWREFFANPQRPTSDFMLERVDLLPQIREWLND